MHKLLAAVTVLAVSTAQADIIYVDADCGSDCCSIHGTPGCDNPSCEAVVCDAFPPCCDVQWDAACVTVATVLCDPLCTEGNGTEGFPYCSIQTAIDNAVDTDELVVAPGTYFEAINFMGKAVWLHSSDGPEVTTIDGTGFLHVVQCVSGEGLDTVLDGFTITGGNANGKGDDRRGGGMSNLFNSNPTVTNCTFSGNNAFGGGGGMQNTNNSSPTVTNCTFSGNTTLGGGGGMGNLNNSNPTVTNCTFSGNMVQLAVGGGGMGNFNDSNPTVTNCILWGNSPDEFGGSSTPTVTFSDVQGGWPGTGNIDADPSFIDPDNGDFRLSPGSPCIDAGNNIAVPAGMTTDLDGNPRFVDDPDTIDTGNGDPPIVDMGAYEFQGTSCPWDCEPTPNGDVGINDFLELLAQWTLVGSSCDFDGGGVGITDFLALLANWGPCP